jgi:dipeptidase D
MQEAIKELLPKGLWAHFSDLNAIPRASKKEAQVIAFIKAFGESLHLETIVDDAGNVIIRKPATEGNESATPVVLQSHLDMVHQKNSDVDFDFATQGINMYIDSDWVKAKGTTLGADNGIGVATIMTLLASTDIKHPAIEALFTIDEETGMTGALELKPGVLKGNLLLNLDTEEDTDLTIGCAGGIDVTANRTYDATKPSGDIAFKIQLKGLTGGHSGVDINSGRANANKLMNRVLYKLTRENNIAIASIDGGSLRNAIPRESVAVIVADEKDRSFVEETIQSLASILKEEYAITDHSLELIAAPCDMPETVFESGFQKKLLSAVYACTNGVYRMSPDIDGLVQTSNNLSRVLVKEGSANIQCLTRSSVDTEKYDLANALTSSFELMDATVTLSGDYPGWKPLPESKIVTIMSDLYKQIFGEPAHVNAIHAGLECGIIGSHYPNMQMISFGPNIFGAHSPDERVQISSVQKFWKFLLATLEKL